MNKRQVQRFLNLILAVEESKQKYLDVTKALHKDGTPSCPLAHYASRPDLQQTFIFDASRGGHHNKHGMTHDKWLVLEQTHFGISEAESDELFGVHDGKTSGTPAECTAYLKRFLIRKLVEETRTPFLDSLLGSALDHVWEDEYGLADHVYETVV